MQLPTAVDVAPLQPSSLTLKHTTGNPLMLFFAPFAQSRRMHSSRMRTVRSSTRLLGGGVSARGGVCLGGVCLGVSARGGVSQHALGQTPPPVDRMTVNGSHQQE